MRSDSKVVLLFQCLVIIKYGICEKDNSNTINTYIHWSKEVFTKFRLRFLLAFSLEGTRQG